MWTTKKMLRMDDVFGYNNPRFPATPFLITNIVTLDLIQSQKIIVYVAKTLNGKSK